MINMAFRVTVSTLSPIPSHHRLLREGGLGAGLPCKKRETDTKSERRGWGIRFSKSTQCEQYDGWGRQRDTEGQRQVVCGIAFILSHILSYLCVRTERGEEEEIRGGVNRERVMDRERGRERKWVWNQFLSCERHGNMSNMAGDGLCVILSTISPVLSY